MKYRLQLTERKSLAPANHDGRYLEVYIAKQEGTSTCDKTVQSTNDLIQRITAVVRFWLECNAGMYGIDWFCSKQAKRVKKDQIYFAVDYYHLFPDELQFKVMLRKVSSISKIRMTNKKKIYYIGLDGGDRSPIAVSHKELRNLLKEKVLMRTPSQLIRSIRRTAVQWAKGLKLDVETVAPGDAVHELKYNKAVIDDVKVDDRYLAVLKKVMEGRQ